MLEFPMTLIDALIRDEQKKYGFEEDVIKSETIH